MGRGRAKAKQQKVARELKYGGPDMDLDRLAAELGADRQPTHDPFSDETPDEDKYADWIEDEDGDAVGDEAPVEYDEDR